MPRKKTTTKKKKRSESKEREPDFMVQIREPKIIRKELLESLREILIFMQSYEKFKEIQDEKVALFTELRNMIKELNIAMDSDLKKYLPKGKSMTPLKEHKEEEIHYKPPKKKEVVVEEPTEATTVKPVSIPPTQESELDELEGQLKEIEEQLKALQ